MLDRVVQAQYLVQTRDLDRSDHRPVGVDDDPEGLASLFCFLRGVEQRGETCRAQEGHAGEVGDAATVSRFAERDDERGLQVGCGVQIDLPCHLDKDRAADRPPGYGQAAVRVGVRLLCHPDDRTGVRRELGLLPGQNGSD